MLLAGSAGLFVLYAVPAMAQEAAAEPAAEAELTPEQAQLEFLKAQVDALQEQLSAIKSQVATAQPSWKGAPQWVDKDAGWSFKIRGRYMQDAAYIESPNAYPNKNLGFSTRVRRFRIGVEGSVPGDFGYKAEVDYNNAVVTFGDVILTYTPKNKPWSIASGNHETFESLAQMSSSRFLSFLERAQMNDAFGHSRRLGISVGLQDKANILRFNAGLFSAHSIDASIDNDGWIGAARATFSPQALGGQLHLGANYQHREFQSNNAGTASVSAGAPSINQIGRYRARPFLQTTGERFVDTGNFAASSDDIIGFELGGIFGPLHVVGEAQWTKVNAYRAGDIVGGLDGFAGTAPIVPSGNPTFFSWYAEAGYFLTGETRGYKNGMWDRTKVLNPIDKGGWGAFQINARYDYLDLTTGKLQNGFTNNFATGVSTPSNDLSRGGKQTGYMASMIWIPTDYVRFLLQYTRTEVEGGPRAAVLNPLSTRPIDELTYGVNSVAVRAQVDF